MLVKQGVNLDRLSVDMRPVLIAADRIWAAHGQECVITSGNEVFDADGKLYHSTGSLHYYGRAVDLRTRFWEPAEQKEVFNELVAAIDGSKFDIVFHKSHIHVELDRGW